MRLLCALVLCAGCLPVTKVTTHVTGRTSGPEVVDRVDPAKLQVEVVGPSIIVHAVWPRRCHHEELERVETETSTSAELVGPPGLVVPLLVLAWPIGLADVVIANMVAADRRTTRVDDHPLEPIQQACPIAAGQLGLHLRLRAGQQIEARTDDDGTAVVVLAADERGEGVAVAADPPAMGWQAPGASVIPRAIRAAPPPPQAPVRATPLPPATARDPIAIALTRTAWSRARAGDCATVKLLAARVRVLDLDYYADVFATDAATAACQP